jgi:T5SS/PEP-CTERM-associated repeat protein
MIAPTLGQDLVVDGGTTNITSSTNYANTYIGSNSTASNNLLNVYGSGVVLSNSANVFVGYEGSDNSLVISNEASVVNQFGVIGYTNNSSNNSVQVTGTNSSWTNETLIIGNKGSSNSLVISNNAGIVSSNGFIGSSATSSNNIVTIIGANSTWTNTLNLRVGLDGSSNSLVVSDGGLVSNSGVVVGQNFASSNNTVLVEGLGSTLNNSSTL